MQTLGDAAQTRLGFLAQLFKEKETTLSRTGFRSTVPVSREDGHRPPAVSSDGMSWHGFFRPVGWCLRAYRTFVAFEGGLGHMIRRFFLPVIMTFVAGWTAASATAPEGGMLVRLTHDGFRSEEHTSELQSH